MNLYQFMGDHPVLTVFILIVVFGGVSDIVRAFKMNRQENAEKEEE